MKGRRPGVKPALNLPPLPPCPDWVNDLARAEWERVTKVVALTALDAGMLEAYCVAFARWREQEVEISDEGAVVKDAKGNPRKNPRVAVAEAYLKHVRGLASELGFTPGSRGRLDNATTPTSEKTSELEHFLGS